MNRTTFMSYGLRYKALQWNIRRLTAKWSLRSSSCILCNLLVSLTGENKKGHTLTSIRTMDGQSFIKTLLNSVNCRSDIAKLRGFQWNSGNSRCNSVSENYVANYYTNGNSFHTIEFQESVICCRPINLLWETPLKYANGDYHYENTKK